MFNDDWQLIEMTPPMTEDLKLKVKRGIPAMDEFERTLDLAYRYGYQMGQRDLLERARGIVKEGEK